MLRLRRGVLVCALAAVGCLFAPWGPAAESAATKAVLRGDNAAPNQLHGQWQPYGQGFQRQDALIVCDNGGDAAARRGANQGVVLNQTSPEPIVASAWSKAEGVSGGADSNYSLYLDLTYADGAQLWGQAAAFSPGTHDWQRRQVIVTPEKPVRRVACYVLFRQHAGKALFRDVQLHTVRAPAGSCLFDGLPVTLQQPGAAGFQVRDVAADSDFVALKTATLGLRLDCQTSQQGGATFYDVTLSDTSGKDRAVTLIYSLPIAPQGLAWLENPRRSEPVAPRREYVHCSRFQAGTGRLSYYPLGAVANATTGAALGIDMLRPAFFRIGYNAAAGELFLAYDLGLAREKPTAKLRFCRYEFAPAWGFRAALARYYELFPEQFRCRTPEQGLWMPFARISKVQGWEDFGFKFKEGNDETAWDDAHGMVTFRYTEPLTWWMRMPKEMPRTMEAAVAEAQRLAEKKQPQAQSLFTSGYHNAQGQLAARLLDTPWCNGAVWSMNSMPGVAGDPTDFKLKWNAKLAEQLYGPQRKGDLDGEYIDSSEGYVTDELDFRREHFAAADAPLTFSFDERQPAIFRGLIVFEYVRAIAADVHARGKLMMANSTPIRLCWLAPLLEVLGTETDWHRQGRWRPMSHDDLLYRRALCKGKPYCFLMNTHFEEFSAALVEKYMQRSLAYGMFPGFFSHNASQGHYFTRPELYDRDRPLFKKYVPLCRRVAEAGWEPVTGFRCGDEHISLERFGVRYLTALNDSDQPRTAVIRADGQRASRGRELLSGREVRFADGRFTLDLPAESVAVIELQ